MNYTYFSIITSIFNQRSFIIKGLDNLINQSFKDYEIILIDDGSNDGSEIFCDHLVKNNNRIRVIHQDNKGLGGARNTGIKNAKGEYICFYDIDDIVGVNWLETIYRLIKDKKPDLLVYSYLEINKKLGTTTKLTFPNLECRNNNEIREIYLEILSGLKFNNGFAWNKVYKREFLKKHKIRFPDLRIQQDEVFNHKVYKYANSLITSSEVLYDYYIFDKGNTRNTFIPERLDIFTSVKNSFIELANYWDIRDKALFYYIHLRFIRNILFNRNHLTYNSLKSFVNELFSSNSIKESIQYILSHSPKKLSKLDKKYIYAIKNQSYSQFLYSEMIYHSINFLRNVYAPVKQYTFIFFARLSIQKLFK